MEFRLVARVFAGSVSMGCVAGCTPIEVDTSGSETSSSDSTSGSPSSTTDDTSTGEATEPTTGEPPAGNRAVDILFVIDNSGSMAEEQALLSQNLAALLDILEAAQADYRVAMTTTDSGNPRCPSATYTPEAGSFVLSSCLDRAQEFMFNSEDYSFACADQCALTDAELQVLPTPTDIDGPAPRKWVERIGGMSNIAGASPVEALRCYPPQGVAGCGFESHLESMYLALAKTSAKDSATNYGFQREAAQLAVIFVSDETDCSHAPQFTDIFTTNKVFWSDPEGVAPTSALCWNAGVRCSGGPGVYSECHAENYDSSGQAGAADADAVLQPLSKYVNFVTQTAMGKQSAAKRPVKVSLITGVPVGYENHENELPYEDSPDPQYQQNFGIGPGCVLGDPGQPEAVAVPPVREREFAEAFAGDVNRNLYSICQQDYSGALKKIAQEIVDDF